MTLSDVLLGRPAASTHAQAEPDAGRGVTIYWRDGCAFCFRLRVALRKHRDRATWVDIWQDPDAAAFVRSTNAGGDEVVPTVVIDGVPHTNPDPGVVVAALSR